MDKAIGEYLGKLTVGQTKAFENMALTPVFGPNRDLGYLVLDEALSNGLKITETNNVQSLGLSNGTGKEVLILLGEYVLGGSQNRMFAQSVYLEKGYSGRVPVNCVQQGRWTTHIPKEFVTSKSMAPRMVASAAYRGQGEVWNTVNYMSSAANFVSPTQDYDEVRRHRDPDAARLSSQFSYTPGAVGIVIVTNNGAQRFSVDLFDSGKTMKKNFDKIVKAAAMEASVGGKIVGEHAPDQLLKRAYGAQATERKAVSLGKDLVIEGTDIEGSALLFDGQPLYLSFGSTSGLPPSGSNPWHHNQGPSTGFIRPRPGGLWVGPPRSHPFFPEGEGNGIRFR